jgi:APA family basic amino acid/polyamine antiporter
MIPLCSGFQRQSASPFLRKPLHIARQQESNQDDRGVEGEQGQRSSNPRLQRHLSVWDLLFIGVGGTVGSGIFVLTGQIASQYSGPATFISFTIAGLAAALSGLCYAELSCRIPVAGSTYVYAYVCLGELAAVLAAACLTLEYAVSGAAVARSWGDKVIDLLTSVGVEWMHSGDTVNLPAFVVSSLSTLLLLAGVQESKSVTNYITAFKMFIVAFMTIGGFLLFQRQNFGPPTAPFGASGVLRGATTSFFGYLGFDEVCCVAGEAINPERDMPRAVIGTLLIVTICYILASLALTGMLPYDQISPTSGFPDAFNSRHVYWAGTLTALGEIVTLPVVVLISLMAQPRLTFSMAQDGLLPTIFAIVSVNGTLHGGTLVSGLLMTLLATFVPFTYLNDLVSAGILVVFSMTCSCLVLLRCESASPQSNVVESFLAFYNGLCFLTALLWSHEFKLLPFQGIWACLSTFTMAVSVLYLAMNCPQSTSFGGSILSGDHADTDSMQYFFATPFVPYLPCLGMAVNWYLVAQLDAWGIFFLLLYLSATCGMYLWRCAPHSVGHRVNWSWESAYQGLDPNESMEVEDHVEFEEYQGPKDAIHKHPENESKGTFA